MKHLLKTLFLALLCASSTIGFAQSPQAVSYQAVARTLEGGPLVDASLIVKIGIIATSIGGNLMWEEEHVVNTDSFGLFSGWLPSEHGRTR
jgi:hypothetical protein